MRDDADLSSADREIIRRWMHEEFPPGESHLIAFYERLGWQLVEGPLVFDQPAGKAIWKDRTMVLPGGGETWPSGVIDLCGLPF